MAYSVSHKVRRDFLPCDLFHLILSGLAILIASITFAQGRVAAAASLHSGMFANLMRSPMQFFDSTPMGRITNRFSKDIDMIDMVIPTTVTLFLMTFLTSLSSLIVISISTPIFMAVLLPLGVIYFLVQVRSSL
jgi:ABC-type multidrug transport system fused ATPase/permease subunit